MNIDFVLAIVVQRRKQLFFITLLTGVITAMLLYFQTPLYKSHTVYTAANPNLGDRANLFRTEFWDQYFYYGSEVDNDRLMAISQSEETLRWLMDTFNLRLHYGYADSLPQTQFKTLAALKKNLQFIKNEYGHVKIVVWDKDKNKAAAMANAIAERTNEKAIAAMNAMKQQIVLRLQQAYQQQQDSLQLLTGNDSFTVLRRKAMTDQLLEKEKLIQQFATSINEVNALFVLEKALPALRKDKPHVLQGAFIAALAAFAFSLLLYMLPALRTKG